MKIRLFSLAALLLGTAPVLADDFLTINNGIVRSFLCVGLGCINPEGYDIFEDTLRLKASNTRIHFNDSSSTDSFPASDWRIVANDSFSGGQNYLAFQDDETGIKPFKVISGAPSNALYVASDGRVGLGTSLPATELHVTGLNRAALRLEASVMGNWEIRSDLNGLALKDRSAVVSRSPLVLENDAPTDAIRVKATTGNVGLGTQFPEGKLHTRGDGVQLAYFESSDGDAVQVRFRTDSENRRFLAVNNANEVKSQIVFGDNQIQFLGETVAQEWLRISSAGIVSSGPTCNPNPCDATFDPDVFTVPPIEERAAYMWENMHLPAVGPTAPGEPFNLTEKTAGMLHELEVAHIYIEQLNAQVTAQQTEIAALKTDHAQQLAEMLARLDRLEATK